MKNRILLLSILFFVACIAQASTITSFTTPDTAASNGRLISISWSGDGVGYNLLATCVQGVKIKNLDGSLYPCDTKVPTSTQNSDSIGLYVINISGLSKKIDFRLYPKTSDGTEDTASMQSVSVTVSPAVQPITAFSSSANTTTSGQPVTLSWNGQDLDGVNFIFSCVDGVKYLAASTDTISMPCGTIAYTDKQSGTGNLSLYFKNNNDDKKAVSIKILPYIGDGSYDLTHSQEIILDVVTDKQIPGQILSFYSSSPNITSGDTLSLLWSTKNLTGVNLKVDCDDSLSFSLATSSGGQNIMCNNLFQNTHFGPNSSLDLVINNSSFSTKTAYITLMPELSLGSFDGINAKKISVVVKPKGDTTLYTGQNTGQTLSTTSSQTTPSQSQLTKPRKKFMKILTIGSRGDDVSALQEFLIKNGFLSGTASGYFGILTKNAIQKFQETYSISKKGQAGYGNFGPATRAKLNSF